MVIDYGLYTSTNLAAVWTKTPLTIHDNNILSVELDNREVNFVSNLY